MRNAQNPSTFPSFPLYDFIYARNGNLVMEYTPGQGEYKNHVYLGGKQIATVKKTGSTFDIDKDGRYDWSEIGQYPGYVSTSTDTTYLNTDVVGSPVVATDRYGNTKWTQNYFPYGERRIKSAANSGKEHTQWFGGKPLDTDTGLSYFGARFYDPAIGRFMGIDPVLPKMPNLHSSNRYAYANNSPYKYYDPDGRYADLVIEAASIGVGVASLGSNLWNGQWGDAGIDALGIVGDGLLAVVPFAPGGFGLSIKASRHVDGAIGIISQAAEARQQVHSLKNFNPGSSGRRPGHAKSGHGWDISDPGMLDIRNNPDKLYVGTNKNGNKVSVFYKDGNVVIADGADSTSIITAYGRSAPKRAKFVNDKWAGDSNFNLVE